MNRWSAGGIALSSVPSRYQHGSVFHASGPDGVPANAAAAYGRCAAAMTSAVAWSTSAAKASRNASVSRNRSAPSLPSALVKGTGLIERPTRLPSNRSRSFCWLSPSSPDGAACAAATAGAGFASDAGWRLAWDPVMCLTVFSVTAPGSFALRRQGRSYPFPAWALRKGRGPAAGARRRSKVIDTRTLTRRHLIGAAGGAAAVGALGPYSGLADGRGRDKRSEDYGFGNDGDIPLD